MSEAVGGRLLNPPSEPDHEVKLTTNGLNSDRTPNLASKSSTRSTISGFFNRLTIDHTLVSAQCHKNTSSLRHHQMLTLDGPVSVTTYVQVRHISDTPQDAPLPALPQLPATHAACCNGRFRASLVIRLRMVAPEPGAPPIFVAQH